MVKNGIAALVLVAGTAAFFGIRRAKDLGTTNYYVQGIAPSAEQDILGAVRANPLSLRFIDDAVQSGFSNFDIMYSLKCGLQEILDRMIKESSRIKFTDITSCWYGQHLEMLGYLTGILDEYGVEWYRNEVAIHQPTVS